MSEGRGAQRAAQKNSCRAGRAIEETPSTQDMHGKTSISMSKLRILYPMGRPIENAIIDKTHAISAKYGIPFRDFTSGSRRTYPASGPGELTNGTSANNVPKGGIPP